MQVFTGIAIMLGALLYCRGLEHKSYYIVRFVGSMVVVLVISLVIERVLRQIDTGAPITYTLLAGLIGYTILSIVAMLPLFVCYMAPAHTLWFVGIAGFTTKSLASCLNLGVSLLNPDVLNVAISAGMSENHFPVGFAMLNLLGSFLLVYAICYRTFAHHFQVNGTEIVKRSSIRFLIICSLAINVWADIVWGVLVHSEGIIGDMVYCALIILSDILLLLLLFGMFSESQTERELEVVRTLWDQACQQYELERTTIEAINCKCHDLKHRLLQVQSRNDGAVDLSDIADSVAIYDSSINTGSEPLDVVLTSKSLYCQHNCIQLACIADGSCLSFMDVSDLYVLFGNLLDNAIEAALGVDDLGRRYVRVSVNRHGCMVYIEVENCFNGQVSFSNDLPVTTKADKSNHGYGTLSITQIVQKYDGSLSFLAKDGVFTVSMVIPV